MSAVTFDKDPADILDFSFDWTQWLGGSDTIVGFTALPSPGITVNSAPFTATSTTVSLSGGTTGLPYTVKHQITLLSGRVKNLTMTIRVTDE